MDEANSQTTLPKKVNRCLVCNAPCKKKFCCLRHKDRWHNRHNPRGIYAHLKGTDDIIDQDDIEDEMHPCDPYSLGQE